MEVHRDMTAAEFEAAQDQVDTTATHIQELLDKLHDLYSRPEGYYMIISGFDHRGEKVYFDRDVFSKMKILVVPLDRLFVEPDALIPLV